MKKRTPPKKTELPPPDARAVHLAFCKRRALEFIKNGDISNAFTSFQNDMRKNQKTAAHPALEIMTRQYFSGFLASAEKMRAFIEKIL